MCDYEQIAFNHRLIYGTSMGFTYTVICGINKQENWLNLVLIIRDVENVSNCII